MKQRFGMKKKRALTALVAATRSGVRKREDLMIHRVVALLVLVLLVAVALPAGGAAAPAAKPYIVVLERGADSEAVARDHGRRYGASVRFTYGHALKGYAATIPDNRVADVRGDARVAYVEPDGTATAMAQTLPWGIDRVDADQSSTKAGDGSGDVSNVQSYIIDSGIDKSHADLSVVGHVNFAGGPNKDCNGHGTHVAGTVAARTTRATWSVSHRVPHRRASRCSAAPAAARTQVSSRASTGSPLTPRSPRSPT